MSQTPATDNRPRRSDAVRNRAAVVRAAAEVFADKGLDAGVPEIAARAGVGKATVYRSFPTKEHLVAAVACQHLQWIAARVGEALDADDPGAAFEEVMTSIAERQAKDSAVAGSLAADIHLPELDEARRTLNAAFDALIERARGAGALRPDATRDDLHVLFTGVASVLRARGEHDAAVWRRHAELIVDALRPRATPERRARRTRPVRTAATPRA
jgi:AcrR family transcriptional regulator